MTAIAPNVIVTPPNREQAQAARRQLRRGILPGIHR